MEKVDSSQRIPRVAFEQRTDEMQEIINIFAGPGRINVDENHVLNTFVQHPELARHFLLFNRYLLMSSTLPVRLRQIAIMRVAWIKKARYVWSSHLRTSLRNGLNGEEFEPIKEGEKSVYWNHEERIVLRAVDQAIENSDLDDDIWREMTTFLNQRQVLDFLFTVGAYELLGMICNSLRIEREDALVELAQKYGAP